MKAWRNIQDVEQNMIEENEDNIQGFLNECKGNKQVYVRKMREMTRKDKINT